MNNCSDICMIDLSLRDYQQKAKESIFSQWDYVDNVLYQMPTGTGKTRLFTSIIRDINVWGLRHNQRKQILIIAHRSELIDQIDSSLDKYHISHGIISGHRKKSRNLTLPVQVASIQTITHVSNYDIANNLNADFIIIDEAHHAMANSYSKLWSLYPLSKKLGVTATPWRMNHLGFRPNFDTLIPSMPIKDFMKCGWLAPYQYYSIPFHSKIHEAIRSISEFDIEGDYKVSALENTMDTDHIRSQLLASYLQFAKGKKGIIYSISRLHSQHICSQYSKAGFRIVNIDSNTPIKERNSYVNDFKNGLIDIIVNVDIFSEGFDCPDIEFIQLARPTRSLVKYIQQVGRGLRKNGNKQCILLDNVGMYSRFGLPNDDRPWEKYFEGEMFGNCEDTECPKTNTASFDSRLVDTSEGTEEMVLIQDIVLQDEMVLNTHNTYIKEESIIKNQSTHIPLNKEFSILSKSFFSGKYKVEVNEKGYFLLNVKNGNRTFLLDTNIFLMGEIHIVKGNSKDTLTIIRSIHRVKPLVDKEIIVGDIVKEGLIIRFSSFDRSINLKNVSV